MSVKTAIYSSVEVPYLTAPQGEPVPEWDSGRLESRACIVCSSLEYEPVCYRPDRLLVARCVNCNCTYLPMVPRDEQLQKYYDDYSDNKLYIQHQVNAERPSFARAALARSVRAFKSLAGDFLTSKIKSRLPFAISDTCELLIRTGGLEGKCILELGPGRFGGILPEASRWGGNGVAVEVDRSAVNAIQTLGIKVYGNVSEVPQNVDIVYAGMVLEHVKDPRRVLNELATLIVPGGRILLRVPNGGQSLTLGKNWIGFRLDLEHLNFFDAGSLSSLLANAGLQTECYWLTSQPILPTYLPMGNRNLFIDYARKRFERRIKNRPDATFDNGDFMLTVLARKEE